MTARARTRDRATAPRLKVIDLFDPPTPPAVADEPVPTPPAWAVEAATAPRTTPPPPPRDFTAAREQVWDGSNRFVLRDRVWSGHEYHAYERSHTHSYGVSFTDPVYGRVDTRRPLRAIDEPRAAIEAQLERQAEALELIHRLCPETVLRPGERAVPDGVYDGPGRVLVTADPARRHRAALEAAGRAGCA